MSNTALLIVVRLDYDVCCACLSAASAMFQTRSAKRDPVTKEDVDTLRYDWLTDNVRREPLLRPISTDETR